MPAGAAHQTIFYELKKIKTMAIDYSIAKMRNPMRPEDAEKWYAFLQYRGTLDIKEIASHIASHGCVYDKADIAAIITKLVDCSKELMLEGYRLQLGDFGKLYLTCSSNAAETSEDFTSTNIRSLNVKFQASDEFEDILRKAVFNNVASRKGQEAVKAAEKAGETVVNLADEEDDEGGEGEGD